MKSQHGKCEFCLLKLQINLAVTAIVCPVIHPQWLSQASQIGNDLELGAVGCQFKSYLTAGCCCILVMVPSSCGVAWDAVPGKLQHKPAFKPQPEQDVP